MGRGSGLALYPVEAFLMKKAILALILLVLIPFSSFAAGAATYTISTPDPKSMIITVSIVDDANGTTLLISGVSGYWLCSMETNPGTTAPQDNYDIVINSASGADILGGAGQNRDQTNTEIAYPTIDSTSGQKGCVPVNGNVSLVLSGNNVANAAVEAKLFFVRH
jgi:hypothetical protein